VTKEIVISGCPRCTECSVQNQEIWQSWWYYYDENGARSPDQIGRATGGSSYSIDVGDIFNNSGEHFIYANYKYLCKNLPEKPNGFVLAFDIKIKLRVVDVGLQCPDEMPIPEGGLVNLQCSAGLPHTFDLKEEFYFDNQNWTCHPLTTYSQPGRRNVHRNPNHHYDCELEISNAQVSDSGYYQCSVYIPGHDPPLMSRTLQLQVVSSLSTDAIVSVGLGAILAVLLLLLATLAVYKVCKSVRVRGRDPERRHLLPRNQDDQNGAPQPLPQPQPQPLLPNNPPVPNGDQQPQPQPHNGNQQPLADPHLQPPLPNGDYQPQPLEVEAGNPHPQPNGKFRWPECPCFPGSVHVVHQMLACELCHNHCIVMNILASLEDRGTPQIVSSVQDS